MEGNGKSNSGRAPYKFLGTKAYREGKLTSPKELAQKYLTSENDNIPPELMNVIPSSANGSYLTAFIHECKKVYESK